MDDPSLLPIVNNNNGNGHHYSDEAMISDNDIEHEEDDYEDDEIVNGDEHVDEEDNDNNEEDEENPTYPEDEIDDDEVDEEEIDEREIQNDSMRQISPTEETAPAAPQPPLTSTNEQINQSERGGRRKGVPRRLQIIPQIENPFQTQQRSSTTATSTNKNSPLIVQPTVHDEHIEQDEDLSHFNNRFSSDYFSEHFNGHRNDDYDENNNHQYYDDENPLEIIDDVLAEIVTKVVHEIRQQRRCNNKETQRFFAQKVNGHSQFKTNLNGPKKHHEKVEQKMNHNKQLTDQFHSNSIKSSKSQSQQSMGLSSSIKMSDSSTLLNELTKMMQSNGSGSHSSGSSNKQKHSLSPSSSSFSTPSSAKRTKLSDTSFPISTSPNSLSIQQQQQHQQLLLQMTQQFLMSTQGADFDGSSLLKQQLLGHTASGTVPTKRPGRPPKQASQPQVMRSSTNMLPSSTNSSPSSFDRTGFAPRRRGRPPKYVTERSVGHLSPHDIDPSSYEQLLAAIENSGNGAGRAAATSAAINTALASLIGHQSGLNLSNSMTQAAAVRNGTPASLMKQSAGQNRQSVPSSTSLTKPGKVHSPISNPLDLALMVPKKRGPGRPPKNQSLIDSHQILQATKRTNSSLSSSNNFPPTMVPSSPSSFSFNPALVEMFHAQQQQQQHQKHQH